MSLQLKSLHELDTYIADNLQPTTCPKCGSRTEFEEIAIDKQQHKCLKLNCKYGFFLDFEGDE